VDMSYNTTHIMLRHARTVEGFSDDAWYGGQAGSEGGTHAAGNGEAQREGMVAPEALNLNLAEEVAKAKAKPRPKNLPVPIRGNAFEVPEKIHVEKIVEVPLSGLYGRITLDSTPS
jgi:hypothetical protein